MAIGTYWCQQKDAWIRVSLYKEQLRTECAQRNTQNPSLSNNWETVNLEGQNWCCSYTKGNKEVETTHFRVQGGILYKTNGSKNPLTDMLNIGKLNADGTWSKYVVRSFNPFDALTVVDASLPAYDQLPILIEEQQKKWDDLRSKSLRKSLISPEISSFVDPTHNQWLYEALESELGAIGCTESNQPSFLTYLQLLDQAISNKEDRVYETIQHLASRTDFDQRSGLNSENDNDQRQILVGQKLSFYFNLLRAEAAYIRVMMDLPEKEVAIAYPQPSKKRLREENQDAADNPFSEEDFPFSAS